jgi:hypothetical protein
MTMCPYLAPNGARLGSANLPTTERSLTVSTLDWIFASILFILYMGCLFTVCYLTFMKGRYVLGIVGIFIPLLWLIGAILPAKEGSRYQMQEAMRLQMMAGQGNQTGPVGPGGAATA